MAQIDPNDHILRQLTFPARYEKLVERLGNEVARLLVKPESSTLSAIEDAAYSVFNRGEGAFVPLEAPSGTGKTTLANNLSYFFGSAYTSTAVHVGEVSNAALCESVREVLKKFPANDTRVVPVNIDHREGDSPSGKELAELKRFLRTPGLGARSVVLWPDTSKKLALEMSSRYEEIAGRAAIDIPVEVKGPERALWPEIASNTLRLSNDFADLEDLGVDPRAYDVEAAASLGAFLRVISDDFMKIRLRMLRAVQKNLRLTIVWVSESTHPGVLAELSSSNRYGMLDASALLDATPGTVVGRWWADHRNLLTQAIVQLDARMFCLPPTASVSALRRHGPESARNALKDFGLGNMGPAVVSRNIGRTDFGKYLSSNVRATRETRGTPADTSIGAFRMLSDVGFTAGRDKSYNNAMAAALADYLTKNSPDETPEVLSETGLEGHPLIPDNSIITGQDVTCIEYTWRSGDFLEKNRATVAAYCLTKLQNYCRELGWIPRES